MRIDKSMTIEQVLQADPGVADILMDSGMHCLGCIMASGEDIAQACAVHGIDVDALVDKINTHLEGK